MQRYYKVIQERRHNMVYAIVCNVPVQFTSVCKCVYSKSMSDVKYCKYSSQKSHREQCSCDYTTAFV